MCVSVCVSLDGVRVSIKLMSFAWIVKHSISFKTISPWLDLCFNILSFSLKWREISMCFCGQDASLTIRALYHGYVCQAWIQTMVINSSTEAEPPKPTPRPKYRQANAKRERVCVYVTAKTPWVFSIICQNIAYLNHIGSLLMWYDAVTELWNIHIYFVV